MSIHRHVAAVVSVIALLSSVGKSATPARFEPPAGKRLLIIGQDMGQ